jgi:replication-associated recombination protein RarA
MPRDKQAYTPVSIAAQGCQNVVPYRGGVRRENREKLLGQTSMVMWFTGPSGSGKSTIAHAVEKRLHTVGRLLTSILTRMMSIEGGQDLQLVAGLRALVPISQIARIRCFL